MTTVTTAEEVRALTALTDRINQAYKSDGAYGRRVSADFIPADEFTAPYLCLREDGHHIPIDTVWYGRAHEPDYHGNRHEEPYFHYGPHFDHVTPAADLDAAARQVAQLAGTSNGQHWLRPQEDRR